MWYRTYKSNSENKDFKSFSNKEEAWVVEIPNHNSNINKVQNVMTPAIMWYRTYKSNSENKDFKTLFDKEEAWVFEIPNHNSNIMYYADL